MDTPLLKELANSIPFLIMLMAQGTLLLLPVDLKNWNDDAINALSYVAFQVFIAGLLFLAIPTLVEGEHPHAFGAAVVIVVVFFSACLRVIKLIPLEFTHPGKPAENNEVAISFVELFDPQRLSLFAGIPLQDAAEEARYLQLHERLVKRRPAKVETAKDGSNPQ